MQMYVVTTPVLQGISKKRAAQKSSPDGQAGQTPARETALLIELKAQIL
jgi:hypothetical protein